MAKSVQVFQLNGRSIPLRVERHARPALRLHFEGPELVLRSPVGHLDGPALRFLDAKAAWIEKHYARQSAAASRAETYRQHLAEQCYLNGELVRISRRVADRRRLTYTPGQIELAAPSAQWRAPAKVVKAALKSVAQRNLPRTVAKAAEEMGLTYNALRVKDVKSRWGSCSSKRNLNFNWHLILLPLALQRYVAVHELAHLRHPNHSAAFWAEVERYFRGAKVHDRALNDWQWLIGIYDSAKNDSLTRT